MHTWRTQTDGLATDHPHTARLAVGASTGFDPGEVDSCVDRKVRSDQRGRSNWSCFSREVELTLQESIFREAS